MQIATLRLWVLSCATAWFGLGVFWGRVELMGVILFGLPIWVCLFATFSKVRPTRTNILGRNSIFATCAASLSLWFLMCYFSASRTGISERLVEYGDIAVPTIIAALFVATPIVAWWFSTPESEALNQEHSRDSKNAG